MKTIFLILLFQTFSTAQTVSVISEEVLKSDGQFYYPKFIPESNSLLLTSSNYKGLWEYNLDTGSMNQINDDLSAGYNFVITSDGKTVVSRRDKFVNRRRFTDVIAYDLKSRKGKVVDENIRDISSFYITPENYLCYLSGENLQIVDLLTDKKISTSVLKEKVALEHDAKIFSCSAEKIIPVKAESGEYFVWSSVIPNENKIIYTSSKTQTEIADFDGNIITKLGFANAPSISPNGKFIAFMRDRDDGHQILSSEIFVSDISGNNLIQLSSNDDIAMYPAWSDDGKRIAYNTLEGKIVILNIKFE